MNDIVIGRFNFDPDNFPEEFLPRLRVKLAVVERLIPDWCYSVRVNYRELEESAAEISARYDYRRAFLTISPIWFHQRSVQTRVLIHELAHITQEPLWNQTIDLRMRLSELAPGWDEYIREQLRHAREQTVCDMTELMMRALGPEYVDD